MHPSQFLLFSSKGRVARASSISSAGSEPSPALSVLSLDALVAPDTPIQFDIISPVSEENSGQNKTTAQSGRCVCARIGIITAKKKDNNGKWGHIFKWNYGLRQLRSLWEILHEDQIWHTLCWMEPQVFLSSRSSLCWYACVIWRCSSWIVWNLFCLQTEQSLWRVGRRHRKQWRYQI